MFVAVARRILLPLLALASLSAPAAAQSSLSWAFGTDNERFKQSVPLGALGPGQIGSERVGREIWFFATADNDRFYTYSFPQRLGAAIDWFKILGAKNRGDLFQAWGAIPDPDCCIPGAPDCPAKSLEETYGFPWCPGDADLLKFVGKEGYRDPACDLKDGPFNANTPHGAKDQRQSPCDLKFGTSTGALGLRKFPNPRFDAEKWKKLNGSLTTWEGYGAFLSGDKKDGDSRTNRIFDGSLEPPFRIGMACGACHIAYSPLNPPANVDAPEWKNIDGLIGNQYSRVSQMLASGMSQHLLEWQLIARARPGTVDTSALPMDTVSNPGTMNAIINLARRPTSEHRVLKWRKAASCPDGKNSANCWCEPGKPGKCWARSELREQVHNILKGGEDSIGAPEAIQRVYFNIGSCAEQCWLNHIPDLRAIDPNQRNYGQTPFDIGQCRRDCAGFRAVEDRLNDVVAFFASSRPTDLAAARKITQEELVADLNREFGEDAVARGRTIFAGTCAGCHSSGRPPFDNVDFRAVDPQDSTLRLDFLSSDQPILASRVGTYTARALHSNHMASRVWDQYAARDLHERPSDPARREVMRGGGRGYYRPVSLLSVWAYAPFMHNNAMGPEVCGKPKNTELDFYSSPYVDASVQPIANPPPCWPFDVSVEGRYRLFKASMQELLNPGKRLSKVNLTDRDIIVDVAPEIALEDLTIGLSIRLKKGKPAVMMNSLRYKDLMQDLILVLRRPQELDKKYAAILPPERLAELKAGLTDLRNLIPTGPGHFTLDIGETKPDFIQAYYSNQLGLMENTGHPFGEGLSDRDKEALIAFLATL